MFGLMSFYCFGIIGYNSNQFNSIIFISLQRQLHVAAHHPMFWVNFFLTMWAETHNQAFIVFIKTFESRFLFFLYWQKLIVTWKWFYLLANFTLGQSNFPLIMLCCCRGAYNAWACHWRTLSEKAGRDWC